MAGLPVVERYAGGMASLLTKRHRLIRPAFPAINRNSFAAKVIREPVCLIHAGDHSSFGKIYRFTDRGVAVLLKGRLHTNVPFRRDIIGAFEDPANFGRDLGHLLNTAGPEYLLDKVVTVKAPFFGDFSENLVSLEQLFARQDLPQKRKRVKRLNT